MSGKTYHAGVTNVEGPTPRDFQSVLACQTSVPPGIRTHFFLARSKALYQSASYPVEFVWMSVGFSTELPPVPSYCCIDSGK
jgi:hypothetical protein